MNDLVTVLAAWIDWRNALNCAKGSGDLFSPIFGQRGCGLVSKTDTRDERGLEEEISTPISRLRHKSKGCTYKAYQAAILVFGLLDQNSLIEAMLRLAS